MSPALNGSSAIWRFEGNDAIKIHDGITFDSYTGLPHVFAIILGVFCFVLAFHFILFHLLTLAILLGRGRGGGREGWGAQAPPCFQKNCVTYVYVICSFYSICS